MFKRLGRLVALSLLFVPAAVSAGGDDDPYIDEILKREGVKEQLPQGAGLPGGGPPSAGAGVDSKVNFLFKHHASTDEAVVAKVAEVKAELLALEGEARTKLLKSLKEGREKAISEAVTDACTAAKVDKQALIKRIVDSRANALKAIMDPAYTESDNCRLQPQVDAATKPIFDAWFRPVEYAQSVWGLNLAGVTKKAEDMAAVCNWFDASTATIPAPHTSASAWVTALANTIISPASEMRAPFLQVYADNNAVDSSIASDEEKKHVAILNDYRIMLGKSPLKINTPLSKAARSHSKFQESQNQIFHNFAGHPDGDTPQARCAKAGFGGPVAENCLMGSTTGEQAFWQWYRAAEHHRNMIGNHVFVGAGQSGVYWTQNFGGGGRPRGPAPAGGGRR